MFFGICSEHGFHQQFSAQGTLAQDATEGDAVGAQSLVGLEDTTKRDAMQVVYRPNIPNIKRYIKSMLQKYVAMYCELKVRFIDLVSVSDGIPPRIGFWWLWWLLLVTHDSL